MVLFNHATREMTAKIVYYGPGLCGKTTNLMVIFDKLDPKQKGKMLSLATKTDRTLFFDLLPVDVGKVGAFSLKIQLYTVPGQVFYNETRKLVLKGADAVLFVADSQPSMVDSTRESFANLMENLEENQTDPNDTPPVIQSNKRDIPRVLPADQPHELRSDRERPARRSGDVSIPVESDEVGELGVEEVVPMEAPVSVAVMDEPEPVTMGDDGRVAALEGEVRQLQQNIRTMEQEHRAAL